VSRTDDQRVLDILDAADLIVAVVGDGRKTWDQDRLRQCRQYGECRCGYARSTSPEWFIELISRSVCLVDGWSDPSTRVFAARTF
jgi:hypothetical protein